MAARGCSTSTSRTSAANASTATATATARHRRSGPYDTSAYCAFDDNFTEFTGQSPTENLQVTAAHELFHAVQFAYDYFEDGWFMEATATWAEDEVYDDVNDNRQYLPESPLGQPGQPMDQFIGLRQYGDWIFFRYLTERFPKSRGGLPVVVREIWERADGSGRGPDDYSLQGDQAGAGQAPHLPAPRSSRSSPTPTVTPLGPTPKGGPTTPRRSGRPGP